MLRLINPSQVRLPQHTMYSDALNQLADEKSLKKVRLPSISSIAKTIPQQASSPRREVHQQVTTSSQNQSQFGEHLNNLQAAAEIFTNLSDSHAAVTPKNSTQENPIITQQSNNYYNPIASQQPVVYQPQPRHTSVPISPPQYQTYQHVPIQSSTTPSTTSQGFFSPQSTNGYTHFTSQSANLIHNDLTRVKPFQSVLPPRRSKERKAKAPLFCQRCGTTETPEWRKGPNGARTLCNACGLFHAKILKRDGPQAAANAIIQVNNIRKKQVPFQRRSLNDYMTGRNFNDDQSVTSNPPMLHQTPIISQHPSHQPTLIIHHQPMPGSIPFQQQQHLQQTAYYQQSTPIQLHPALHNNGQIIQQVPITLIPASQIHYSGNPLTIVSPAPSQIMLPNTMSKSSENLNHHHTR